MRNLLLAPAEIDSERKVVMEERRSRIDDDPEGVVYEAMSSMAFLAHPYRWPIIGWMSDIARIDPAELRAFYDTYYQPNNAILVIAGDVKAPDALALVRRHFGPIPRGANPAAGDRARAAPERRAAGDRAQGGRAAAGGEHRLARAELPLGRRARARGAVDDPLGRAGLAPLPAPGLRQAHGAGGGRRVLLLLARPDPLLVLRHAPARPDPGGGGAGASRRGGAAQEGAGAGRGAGAGAEPDRGLVRVAAGLGLLARVGPGPLRDAGLVAPAGRLPAADPQGDRGRSASRSPGATSRSTGRTSRSCSRPSPPRRPPDEAPPEALGGCGRPRPRRRARPDGGDVRPGGGSAGPARGPPQRSGAARGGAARHPDRGGPRLGAGGRGARSRGRARPRQPDRRHAHARHRAALRARARSGHRVRGRQPRGRRRA